MYFLIGFIFAVLLAGFITANVVFKWIEIKSIDNTIEDLMGESDLEDALFAALMLVLISTLTTLLLLLVWPIAIWVVILVIISKYKEKQYKQ